MSLQEEPSSPRWTTNTKLVIGLALGAIMVVLLIRFKDFLAPLMLSVLLAYLFHPAANFFNRKLKIPWQAIVPILYILLFLVIIGLLAWGGISIADQVQNLIKFFQELSTDLGGWIESISSQPLKIGPYTFSLELDDLWNELLNSIQPILANLGNLVGSLASGIGSTVTWLVFILLISYFILAGSNSAQTGLIKIRIPKYQEDFAKIGQQLGHIWNAFLRGQLLIILITVAYYSALLSILGVRYFFLLAIMAGLARLLPYIGPFVVWVTYALVALFQTNYFGLPPLPYALIVVGCAWFSDVLLDNLLVPRVMSDALAIHPAAVLVMVIISARLFGIVGVLLASPLLASIKLIFNYIFCKLSDQDPWTGLKVITPPEPLPVTINRFVKRLLIFVKMTWKWMKKTYYGAINILDKIRGKLKGENHDRKL